MKNLFILLLLSTTSFAQQIEVPFDGRYQLKGTSPTQDLQGITDNGATTTNNITAPRFISNISTGTAPLGISSTTLVSNLNVQYLNGLQSADFQPIENQRVSTTNTPSFAGLTSTASININGNVGGTNVFTRYQSNGTNRFALGLDAALTGGNVSDINFYLYGSNSMFLSTNNNKRITILGGGNVGISNTSPSTTFMVGTSFGVHSTGYITNYPGASSLGLYCTWSPSNNRVEFASPMPINTLTATGTTVVPTTAMQATYKLDCSGGNRTFTFTPAFTGQVIVVKRIDGTGNTCTIQATSGNIDGSPNRTLITQYESLQLQWDGTNLNALN